MKRTEELACFLSTHPNATNQDIAQELNISEGYAKKLVHDLKKIGAIEVSNNKDERTIQVYADKIHSKRIEDNMSRRERVEQLLDIVFEALEHETQFDSIISAGHLVIKLLDRL